jgi:hypothetical protein
MAESKSHKTTASRLAKKFNTDYNQGQGADVQAKKAAIEIETPETVGDASRQLQGHKKPVYIAGQTKMLLRRHWMPRREQLLE